MSPNAEKTLIIAIVVEYPTRSRIQATCASVHSSDEYEKRGTRLKTMVHQDSSYNNKSSGKVLNDVMLLVSAYVLQSNAVISSRPLFLGCFGSLKRQLALLYIVFIAYHRQQNSNSSRTTSFLQFTSTLSSSTNVIYWLVRRKTLVAVGFLVHPGSSTSFSEVDISKNPGPSASSFTRPQKLVLWRLDSDENSYDA